MTAYRTIAGIIVLMVGLACCTESLPAQSTRGQRSNRTQTSRTQRPTRSTQSSSPSRTSSASRQSSAQPRTSGQSSTRQQYSSQRTQQPAQRPSTQKPSAPRTVPSRSTPRPSNTRPSHSKPSTSRTTPGASTKPSTPSRQPSSQPSRQPGRQPSGSTTRPSASGQPRPVPGGTTSPSNLPKGNPSVPPISNWQRSDTLLKKAQQNQVPSGAKRSPGSAPFSLQPVTRPATLPSSSAGETATRGIPLNVLNPGTASPGATTSSPTSSSPTSLADVLSGRAPAANDRPRGRLTPGQSPMEPESESPSSSATAAGSGSDSNDTPSSNSSTSSSTSSSGNGSSNPPQYLPKPEEDSSSGNDSPGLLGGLLGQAQDAVGDAVGSAQGAASDAADNLMDAANDLADSGSELAQDLMDQAQQAAEGAAAGAVETGQAMAQQGAQAGAKIAKASRKVANKIEDVPAIAGQVLEKGSELAGQGGNALLDVAQQAVDATPLPTSPQELMDRGAEVGERAAGLGHQGLEFAGDQIGNQAGQIREGLQQAGQQLGQQVGQGIQRGKAHWNDAVAGVEDRIDSTYGQDNNHDPSDGVDDPIEFLMQQHLSGARQQEDKLKEGLQQAGVPESAIPVGPSQIAEAMLRQEAQIREGKAAADRAVAQAIQARLAGEKRAEELRQQFENRMAPDESSNESSPSSSQSASDGGRGTNVVTEEQRLAQQMAQRQTQPQDQNNTDGGRGTNVVTEEQRLAQQMAQRQTQPQEQSNLEGGRGTNVVTEEQRRAEQMAQRQTPPQDQANMDGGRGTNVVTEEQRLAQQMAQRQTQPQDQENMEGGRGTNVITEDQRRAEQQENAQGGRGTNVITEDQRNPQPSTQPNRSPGNDNDAATDSMTDTNGRQTEPPFPIPAGRTDSHQPEGQPETTEPQPTNPSTSPSSDPASDPAGQPAPASDAETQPSDESTDHEPASQDDSGLPAWPEQAPTIPLPLDPIPDSTIGGSGYDGPYDAPLPDEPQLMESSGFSAGEDSANDALVDSVPVVANLEVTDLRFLDLGHPAHRSAGGEEIAAVGPRFRVTIRNHDPQTTVRNLAIQLIAARDLTAPTPVQVSVVGQLPAIEPQSDQSLELVLDPQSLQLTDQQGNAVGPFQQLAVIADPDGVVDDQQPENNVLVQRLEEIQHADLKVVELSGDPVTGLQITAGQALPIVGEGFGFDQGVAALVIRGQAYPLELQGWSPARIEARVPSFSLTEVTAAKLVIVRPDRQNTQPIDLQLLPTEPTPQ